MDDFCSLCWEGGMLLGCDQCPRAYHFDCAKLSPTEFKRNPHLSFLCSHIAEFCTSRSFPFDSEYWEDCHISVSRPIGQSEDQERTFFKKLVFNEWIIELDSFVLIDTIWLNLIPETIRPRIGSKVDPFPAHVRGIFEDTLGKQFIKVDPYLFAESVPGARHLARNTSAGIPVVALDQDLDLQVNLLCIFDIQDAQVAYGNNDMEASYVCIGTFDSESGSVLPLFSLSQDPSLFSTQVPFSDRKVLIEDEDLETPYDLVCLSLKGCEESLASLPQRESEFEDIKSFIVHSIKSKSPGSGLYLSGVPGTGKTATVRRVLKNLRKNHRNFVCAEINALKLASPKHLYSELLAIIQSRPAKSKHSALFSPRVSLKRLEAIFSSKQRQSKSLLVLVVDELDCLVSKSQEELYNLFNWPTLDGANMLVIGISNTMDLPERLSPRVRSRLGMKRIVFRPYNHQDIGLILNQKLKNSSLFTSDAVEYCSRKVAAVSGDIRRAIQICCRAAMNCKRKYLESSANQVIQIDTADVVAAVNELFDSCFVAYIKSTTEDNQLLLCTLALIKKNQETEFISMHSLVSRHRAMCELNGIEVRSESEIIRASEKLDRVNVVVLERRIKKHGPMKYSELSIRLNIPVEDISFAFRDHAVFVRILDL
jgi:origin recognition complex subunit 1